MDINQVTDYQDKFKLKVKASERTVSSVKPDGTGGNPMDVVDLEFVDNAPITVRNPDTGEMETLEVNGLQVRNWVTLTPKAIGPVNTFRKAIGLPTITADELSTVDGNLYIGKVCEAIVRFSGRAMKNSAGQDIMHNGRPVMTSERKIVKLLA